jgi:hypothetical protein
MIAKRAFSIENDTETIGTSIIPLAIELLEKFLKIEKPTVLIVAMTNFIDTLLAFIGFECTSAKEQIGGFWVLKSMKNCPIRLK